MKIKVTINGKLHKLTAAANETLLALLRRAGFIGAKYGCGDGSCGACAVLLMGD